MSFHTLQLRLLKADTHTLSKRLGYAKGKNFARAIHNISKAKNLAEFLYSGHFDWIYSSKTLVLNLAKIWRLDISDELKEAEIYNDERRRYNDAYISIDKSFKRNGESIFYIMARWGQSRIKLHDMSELYFKSLDEQLKIVGKLIKQNYKTMDKDRLICTITSYTLHLFGKAYTFNTQGEFLGEKDGQI